MRRLLTAALVLLTSSAALAQEAPEIRCPPVPAAASAERIQAGARAARDRGFLWRISKGDRISYLFGTVHIGRFDWVFPGPQLRAALAATEVLALELDVSDPQTMASAQAAARAVPAPTLTAALRERLARQVTLACLPPEAMAGLHPILQAVTLISLAARSDGLDPGYGQEFVLAQAARSGSRTIVALETAALQMNLLLPLDPAESVRMIETLLDQLEQGRASIGLVRIGAVWERGDLSQLQDYESWCECIVSDEDRALLRRLNDERNPNLADRIDSLHTGGKRVLAAVGALHMSGPQGLPRLMRERGYTVERVDFAK